MGEIIRRIEEYILAETGCGTDLVPALAIVREEDILRLGEILVGTISIRAAGIVRMPYIEEFSIGVLQHDLMLTTGRAEDKTDRDMHLQIGSLLQVFLVMMVFTSGGSAERVRAGKVDIGVHIIIGEITEVVAVVGYALVRYIQTHLEPTAGMQVEVNARLEIRGHFAFAMPEQQSVQREVQMRMQVELAADGIVSVQSDRVLQNTSGEGAAGPLIAIESRIDRCDGRTEIDLVAEMVLRRTEEDERVERPHMDGEPRQDGLLVVDGPTQLMRVAICHPRRKTLAVDIKDVLAETQRVVLYGIGGPGQTGREVLPLGEELGGVVLMVVYLVVVIEVLTAAVLFAGEIKTIAEARKDAIGFHRKEAVCLHFVVVGGVVRVLGDQALLVLTGDTPFAKGSIEMLAEGVAFLIAESVSGVYVSCSAQMSTGSDMLELVGTLHGGTMGDVDDRRRTGCGFAVAYLSYIVLNLHIIACGGVGGELELPVMGVDEQVILLHVRHKDTVARGKAVVHPHAVDRIGGHRTGQTCYGKTESVGMPPLTGHRVLHNHMIIERLQIIDEVGAVVPFTEILRRHAVATVHGGVADLQCPCGARNKE